MLIATQPVMEQRVSIAIPYAEEQPMLRCCDFQRFERLNIQTNEQCQAMLDACRGLAHDLIARHLPHVDGTVFQRGMRWAATTQLLQTLLLGEADACVIEFDRYNSHIIGDRVVFIQAALDDEISHLVDTGRCPNNSEGLAHAAMQALIAATTIH